MKLTEKSSAVYNYIANNGKVSVEDLAVAMGVSARSVNANITDLCKKGLAERSKEDVGAEKPVTFVTLTPDAAALLAAED